LLLHNVQIIKKKKKKKDIHADVLLSWLQNDTFNLSSYRQHRELKNVIRKMMAIGYLPVLLVRQNFHL
jgi:hypothetical protein